MLTNKPPMGWNSWNTFGWNISESLICEIADAMVNLGYLDAGYTYLVIDDCWSEQERDNRGRLVADRNKFPSGIKAVADYVHSKGLKFGMYSCAGVRTCANFPGSFGHEFVDAQTFAEWGVDYLKYDYCFRPAHASGELLYRKMGLALRNCGRDILYSACNWGNDGCLKWIRSVGADIYRSTGDIQDNFISIRDIFESQIDKFYAVGPQCYNDMDMLVCGMNGKGNVAIGNTCTLEEYKTHFYLWSMFGSPLMIGGDIRKFDNATRSYLQNKSIIEINQQNEYRTPYVVHNEDHKYIFAKLLEGGDLAVAFVNLSDSDYGIICLLSELGLSIDSGYSMEFTDMETGEKTGVYTEHFLNIIKAHECKIYRAHMVKNNELF